MPYDYFHNNFTFFGIINYPKFCLSVSFTHSKCECLSTDPSDLVSLSQASYFQTKVQSRVRDTPADSDDVRISMALQGGESRGWGEGKNKAAESGETSVEKGMTTGATPPLVKLVEGFLATLVANTWFYFVFKLLWNRLQSYIPAEPQHPGFSFQADAQNSEVLFSYKHVLWLPLCLAIHIPWTHLWEKIICLHQKQLLHHLTHVSPFTRRESLILNPSNLPRTHLSPFRFTSCAFLRTKGQKTALVTSETCSSVPGQLHFSCNWMVLWRHMAFYAVGEPKEGCLNNLPLFCLAPAKKKWQ